MNLKLKKESFKFTIKFTRVYGYIEYIRTTNDEPISREPMDKEKQTVNSAVAPSLTSEEQCFILMECHQAYQEDVICGSMSYEDFGSTFFGMSGSSDGYRCVRQMFREHQPIIEYRFKSSAFCEEDAMAMLQEFEHCNSFFDRSLIDIQLTPIIPKLRTSDLVQQLTNCANEVSMFEVPVTEQDITDILTGNSKTDYGIYCVSHFAYFMKELEKRRLLVHHWQAMIARLSRIVYHGHYITQTALSTSVNRLCLQMRRPWIYDAIDDWMQNIPQMFTGNVSSK